MSTRYAPFEEMDRLFEQLRRTAFGLSGYDERDHRDGVRPAMVDVDDNDMSQIGSRWHDANVSMEPTEEGYVVLADLPGFERDEIDLHVRNGVLSITAIHDVEQSREADGTKSGMRRHRRVDERVRLPDGIDPATATATYRNGVLELHFPADGAPERGTAIDVA